MQQVKALSGVELSVLLTEREGIVDARVVPAEPTEAVLHWGMKTATGASWQQPEAWGWPSGSEPYGSQAVRTPLAGRSKDDPAVIRIDEKARFVAMEFVLHHPDSDRWDDNQGQNYRVDLPPSRYNRTLIDLTRELAGTDVASEMTEALDDGSTLVVVAAKLGEGLRVLIATDRPGPTSLHWGIARDRRRRWEAPPEKMRPVGTKQVSDAAVSTPFEQRDGVEYFELEVADDADIVGVSFVVRDEEQDRWLGSKSGDFFVRVPRDGATELSLPLTALAETIVDHEVNRGSWTLMHRFNLAHELVQGLDNGDREGLALIFVWLRYSALRQLDWQRNYNTQPRELSHAADRFTRLLAYRYERDVASRKILRWIMPTLGRGGEGQKVRDGILQIMHRHNIKEVTGRFLEEWHQKLHNNTTPDDIVICRAYLAFLRSGGDVGAFYESLEAGGVSRERLRKFERPIRTDPDFVPHLRDGLVHDFEEFLRLLKSVHDGTDLEAALRSADRVLDPDVRADAWRIHEQRNSDDIVALARTVSRVRQWIDARGQGDGDDGRDLLSLDVALEEFLRVAMERSSRARQDDRVMMELVPIALHNLFLSEGRGTELQSNVRQWERLAEAESRDELWALRTNAAVDRVSRALADGIDASYRLLQPKAEYLGRAFDAEPWTIQLFSEEVLRGRLEFVVAMLLRRFERVLMQMAGMPACRVVSRGTGSARGRVLVTEDLGALQGRSLSEPTVVIAEHVAGDEELPALVSAVLTPDAVDLVSHVAVRARNTGLVMATIHDESQFTKLRGWSGTSIGLRVTPSDEIVRDDDSQTLAAATEQEKPKRTQTPVAPFEAFVLPLSEVNTSCAGGKSNHLRSLRRKLPAWIRVPRSMVIPFAVFDFVLQHPSNEVLRERHARAVARLADVGEESLPEAAKLVREGIGALAQPEEMIEALRRAAGACELPWPADDWEAWRCITAVWASKWNDRAVWNRRTRGMPDDDLHMAVLVQAVSEAQYSYVLHTVHPTSGDRGWGYGEVVVGLGEVLVGNHPGRPLGFSWNKESSEVRLSSMPSKRVALKGGGLIFRSDSTGEDDVEHAGAGLYESVQLPPPQQEVLDYASEPLVWDDALRAEMLPKLGQVGQTIEEAMGSPQDIEGTYRQGEYVVVQTRPQVGVGD